MPPSMARRVGRRDLRERRFADMKNPSRQELQRPGECRNPGGPVHAGCAILTGYISGDVDDDVDGRFRRMDALPRPA